MERQKLNMFHLLVLYSIYLVAVLPNLKLEIILLITYEMQKSARIYLSDPCKIK